MKRLLFAGIAIFAAAPALAGDVSASIGISQPGLYGQINIGDFPRPAVIYAQPVWIDRPRKVVYVEPVYMHIPPGHEKNWSKHCGQYGACRNLCVDRPDQARLNPQFASFDQRVSAPTHASGGDDVQAKPRCEAGSLQRHV